ncbi:hypothetical protein GGS26DRAFT_553460 [Hypomontagnella submonticulosa]|nr:hypothetical protein GGS26DRAFT_553460 [Hypomontagnella submonticulosa]
MATSQHRMDADSSYGAATGNDYSQRSEPQPSPSPDESKKYVRMCWICHDEVEPTYEEAGFLDGIRQKRPKRRYVSEDGDRLINPCRCKGSVKYVHEGCLKLWMNENPDAWKCDRCHYQYRMERLTWAQRLRSPLVALGLTILILLVTIFLLGFIADPILNLWLDPVGTIAETVTTGHMIIDEEDDLDLLAEEMGWFGHFLKGLFSLGLLGFVKAFLVMSPWQWWNLRASGIVGGGGGRRAGNGRDRMENLNLALIIIGVFTFLYTVWKATRKWTERTLDRASQRILNVQRDNNDDDDDDSDEDE